MEELQNVALREKKQVYNSMYSVTICEKKKIEICMSSLTYSLNIFEQMHKNLEKVNAYTEDMGG